MRRAYIYYRSGEAGMPAAVQASRRLFGQLLPRWPGLRAELLQRADPATGEVTLMEIYERPAGGIDAAMLRDIEATAADVFAGLAIGRRRVETFEPAP